ncbi:hypothetical protein EDD11_002230 [Mortierella claussenii]|nr:hypothetical protein EDD11_002230 [Mortierella claussenii]
MAGLSVSAPSSAGVAGPLSSLSSPSASAFPFSPAGNAASQGLGLQFGTSAGGGSKTTRGEGGTGAGSSFSGSRTQYHAPLEPEVVARLDELFFKFLQRICSDLNACDSRGDQIHQPLMAKKMQRLEASTDFRPFKFRIQAFTNAFHESLVQHGLSEDILPLRKVKVYLWKHKYISRFNEDGKKQKSKGNHVWNIEARKIPTSVGAAGPSSTASASTSSAPASASTSTLSAAVTTGPLSTSTYSSDPPIRWEFREYTSRIAGQIIKFARVGVPYVYTPRIWDAQMSCPIAEYSSPWLPSWLKWHRGELRGIPGPEDRSCSITVVAEYMREGEKCHLELTFPLTVSDPDKEGELMDSPNEDEDDLQEDDGGDSSNGEDEDEDDEMSEYQRAQDIGATPGGEVSRGRGRYRKPGRERKTGGAAGAGAQAKERQESKRRKQTK